MQQRTTTATRVRDAASGDGRRSLLPTTSADSNYAPLLVANLCKEFPVPGGFASVAEAENSMFSALKTLETGKFVSIIRQDGKKRDVMTWKVVVAR